MKQFLNRKQLCSASDEEIEKFFSETVFEGVYSHEIKSKNTDYYNGSITDIKLNGRQTNLAPLFLNVPKTSVEIAEGPCSFKCRMNLNALRADEPKYIVNLVGASLRAISSLTESNVTVSFKDSKEQDLFEMWGVDNCQCIGFYHYDEESEVYIVDDLRKPNFDHIPYYPGDVEMKPIRITYPHEIRGIKLNDYYLFTWKLSHKNRLNPYEIYLDFASQPKNIDPKWFIDTLFDDRHNDKSKNFGSATNFLDTLSKQLSAKESTFVYELLQNANDYPVEGQSVDVEFHITENYLLFLHTGDKFNVRNISGICGINEKEKVANKKTIGYKGIGFKTVFLNNHYVYIRTGAYSFRFDEGETPEKKVGGKIRRLGAPFQILPIWTSHQEVATEVNKVFDHVSKNFRVQIALRPDSNKLLHIGKNSYENLFRDVFSDSNIILFIPNINSVRVFINGHEERSCFRNNEEWIVGDYENEIDTDLQALINRTIEKGNSRIPEKYKDFDYTKVSFACKHEGAIIKSVDDATLYCYLPTRASWGLPFLMNTDMIPKGDRNDIETEVKLLDEDETNFNEELAAIAGSKLFLWVKDLLTSRKYQLGSVFSLIPDFKKCKKEHKYYADFIERFESAFDECLEDEQIVPVRGGLAFVNSVILDTTGLSTSGIMSDEEFCKFLGMENYHLPLELLRKDKRFNSFLKRYATDEQIFDQDRLTELISNDEFKEWLKNQDNNDKFLNFLLENEYLEDYLDEDIFIEEECGKLFSANELYYDIDEELKNLSAFSTHLFFLSFKTRDFFKGNEKWNDIKDKFAKFNADDFVDNILLSHDNEADTKAKLKDNDTSIHFYKFLAENVGYSSNYRSLPFINGKGESIDDFNDKILFFASEEGRRVCDSEWLSDVEIDFISDNYTEKTKQYFAENFDVKMFAHEYIVKNVILSDDYKDDITASIDEDSEISKSFIEYCFAHNDLIQAGELRSYSLHVYDCAGDEQWCLTEDHIYFPSELFDRYSAKGWIESDWMYVLDNSYFEGITDKDAFTKFIESKFWASKLTEESFYSDVVRANLSQIFGLTSGNNDGDGSKNIDFVHYLDSNYDLIFGEHKDADKFAKFIPVSSECADMSIDESAYSYDSELEEITQAAWFPEDTVCLCSKDYGNSKAIIAMGCKEFNFSKFYDDVIVKNITAINANISNIEESIAFHSFIIENLSSLTTGQQEKMKAAKVFLYGNDQASMSASGHKILSSKAKELLQQGLVSFEDLDIIDPQYKTEKNSEYWETRLGNTKFTVSHFFSWLEKNQKTITSTIQDADLNVKFWRWMKNNAKDDVLEQLPTLPVLLKDGNIDNSNEAVYFSDEYMHGANIERSIKRFDENALFLSPNYIDEDDEVEDWKNFWIKIGIKHEMFDILVETVIPNLDDIDDEGLPMLFAENREALEKHYDDGLIPQLTELRIKGKDGNFHCIADALYVDCEKEEPFAYITLPNQVTLNTAEERRLIKDLLEEVDGDIIETLSEWQQHKIDQYLELQSNNDESIRDFHYQLIDELSAIRNDDRNSLKEIERIDQINLFNRNNEFCQPSSLTMGSVYKPFFDFEACGIDVDYVSDSYDSECTEYPGKLFRVMKVHCDFFEEDIPHLQERKCAIYFWSEYLVKRDAPISRIKDIITDGKLNVIACIPTKDNMKCPSDLYYGKDVASYVKKIEDWGNKVPLTDLPDIKATDDKSLFDLLPFKDSLEFLDALYALISITGQDKRTQLLQWMIDDFDESYNSKVDEYREDEHALWKNNKNEDVQIKRLYALDYWDKSLEQYFGTNPRIVNKAYFPTGDSFKTACDIIGIQTITSDDLTMEPVGDTVFSSCDRDLRLYALVIAGLINSDGWSDLYSNYCQKLDILTLHKCRSILITYKEDSDINQSLKKFYHKPDTNDFYFVDSLDGKRVFKSFVDEFVKFLGINKDEIAEDVIEDIMDSRENALDIAKDQNSLMLDEAFKEELERLNPGIKSTLSGKKANDNDENDELTYQPSFSTEQQPEDIDTSDDGSYDEPDYDGSENETTDSPDTDLEDIEYLREEDIDDDNEREAIEKSGGVDVDDFCSITKLFYSYDGNEVETVCEHYRSGTWVRGHYRNGYWVNGYWRNGSTVSEHDRISNHSNNGSSVHPQTYLNENSGEHHTNTTNRTAAQSNDKNVYDSPKPHRNEETTDDNPQHRGAYKPRERANNGQHPYADNSGWNDKSRPYRQMEPKPFSPEDVRNFGSHGQPRSLDVLEPTQAEVDDINRILDGDLTAGQVADQNYLAQLRLYRNLQKNNMQPQESEDEFVRNAHLKNEHALRGGKYIHKCSAAGGIMYLSPSIWNKIADDNCVVCVYLGAKANEFMYFNSIDEILQWIKEDDIVIKLTGEEKADVVQKLYSGILNGVKGTAYTLIRINSNEKYNSLFAPLSNNEIDAMEENADDY